jgi:hypothetical protein
LLAQCLLVQAAPLNPSQDGKRGSFRGQAPLPAVFRRTTQIRRLTALSKLGRKGRCPAFQYTDECAN